jgi:hypothetical protein
MATSVPEENAMMSNSSSSAPSRAVVGAEFKGAFLDLKRHEASRRW